MQALNTLAQRLMFIMEQNNYTHNDVARQCGLSQGAVSYIIRSNATRTKLAYELATGLNISFEWLVTGKGTPSPSYIYKIPLFYTIYDCFKYKKDPDGFQGSFDYVYTGKTELSYKSFAFAIQNGIIAIASYKSFNKKEIPFYLNVLSFVDADCNIKTTKEGEISFPVLEIRICSNNVQNIQAGVIDVGKDS